MKQKEDFMIHVNTKDSIYTDEMIIYQGAKIFIILRSDQLRSHENGEIRCSEDADTQR